MAKDEGQTESSLPAPRRDGPPLVANKAGTVAHHSAVIAGNVKQGREKSR